MASAISRRETSDFVLGLEQWFPCRFLRSGPPNVSPGRSQALEIIRREIFRFRGALCFQGLAPILVSPLFASPPRFRAHQRVSAFDPMPK